MRTREIILLGILLAGVACQSQRGNKQTSNEGDTPAQKSDTIYAEGTRPFERTVGDIRTIASLEELDYAIVHFWDGFDFECGERAKEYNTDELCQALIDYILLFYNTGDYTPLRHLMERASASREVLDLFMTVTEIVLHDPNSPMRNDELYIPILEYLVECPLLDEYDRLIPEHDLHIAKQNRIGHTANNIIYTTADGRRGELHSIVADYTLLMFNNPDCPACRMIMENITASPLMNEMQEMGRLRVVAIYPDSDLEAWRNYLSKMPRRWIVAYDEGQRITESRSYDLRAIPSLYLLDENKRVIVKDGIDVAMIDNIIALRESETTR